MQINMIRIAAMIGEALIPRFRSEVEPSHSDTRTTAVAVNDHLPAQNGVAEGSAGLQSIRESDALVINYTTYGKASLLMRCPTLRGHTNTGLITSTMYAEYGEQTREIDQLRRSGAGTDACAVHEARCREIEATAYKAVAG